MNAKRFCLAVMIAIGSILSITMNGCTTSDLRKSSEEIKAALLKEKPLGTPMAEIETWLRTEKKLEPHVYHNHGFDKQALPKFTTVGQQSIEAKLGEYRSLRAVTSVEAYWGFDSAGKLIEVWVDSTSEGL